MCEFFSSVFCTETDDKFKPVEDKICSYNCTPIAITVGDVLKRLNKLNVNKSEGPDLIHPTVIYEIRHEIAQPLAMLFNRSLESSQIATIWKCANISPIHKKGRKNEVNNYRPVSLTCIHTLQSHRTYIVRDKVLDPLEPGDLRLEQVVIQRVAVVKLGVNNGSGDGGSCFGVEVWTDTAKLTNMVIAGFGL